MALYQKKIQDILSALLRKQIILENPDKVLISRGFDEIEKFKEILLKSSPALWVPVLNQSPFLFLEKKKISKDMKNLRQILSQVFYNCGGEQSEHLSVFFVLCLLIGLASTSPKKSCLLSSATRKTNTEAITIENTYRPSFDLAGFRFYQTMDYVTLLDYDIPGGSLIITKLQSI